MNNILNTGRLALVRNIKIRCSFDKAYVLDNAAIEKAVKLIKTTKLFNFISEKQAFVYKKSVDAREKKEIFLVYTIAFPIIDKIDFNTLKGVDIVEISNPENMFVTNKKTSKRPLVVGFGPSGMFCALSLAKAGLSPVVIERGEDIDKRALSVENYWKHGELNAESNVQFGEGGAGTFSDGKLLTRISDKLCNYVLSEFVKHGAPDEIMYLAKPHIGTDNLRNIVKNIRKEIVELGGSVRFGTKLEAVETDSNNRITACILSGGERIECDSVFLCLGHSARDTVLKLRDCGVRVEPKPFSVGLRIEHLRQKIDEALYGSFAGCDSLGSASYTLSRKLDGRAVYSFCMCPGGVVVASASENGQIVTNGMSYYSRDGVNSNSAIAVSVDTSDYGNTVEGAIDFQHSIEKKAFICAGGQGAAPVQLLGDFLDDTLLCEPSRILPTYTGKTSMVKVDDVLPKFVSQKLRDGIVMFERDIEGFCDSNAVLTFPETRTSSPVKIPRDEHYLAIGFKNLYPCGEGAGYAGGITSAAVDGIRCALSYLNS